MKMHFYANGEYIYTRYNWPHVPRVGECVGINAPSLSYYEVTSVAYNETDSSEPYINIMMKVSPL
jgi:hypothetical protein